MKNSAIFRRIICIVLTVILLKCTTSVYAVDSFKTSLSVDSSSKHRGEEITVFISINDIAIESGEKGIGAYTAKIDFDSSVLEYVDTAGTEKWEKPTFQQGLIVGNTADGEVVKTNQRIGSIIFKVKDSAKLGNTVIKLTNFAGSTAKTDIIAQDSSIKVTITEKKNNENNSDNGNDDNSNNGNNSDNSDENDKNNSNGSDSNNSNNNNSSNNSSNSNNNSNSGNGSNGSNLSDGTGGSNSNNKNSGGSSNFNINSNNQSDSKKGFLPFTGSTTSIISYIILALIIILIIRLVVVRTIYNKEKKKIVKIEKNDKK